MAAQSDYYQTRDSIIITRLSSRVRKRVFDLFFRRFGASDRIIDVGVTAEQQSVEANFFEKLFPDKEKVTAVGVEDASFLETQYPGVKFRQIQPNARLPFEDGSFDVAFSHAVIEHIVDPAQQRFFLSELLRVARSAFVTTPNKYFWIEPHTQMPFIHFLFPRLFYSLLDKRIVNGFYNSSNLRLMSRQDLASLAGSLAGVDATIESVKLFGITSNLVLTLTRAA